MTISTAAKLETGLNSQFSRIYATKVTQNAGNSGTGFYHSYWYVQSGFPPSGLAPTSTVAALSNATTGALPFTQQTSPRTSYLADLTVTCNVSTGKTVEIHDRLIQITIASVSTTPLTVTGFDLNSFLATNNIGNRIGDANYSDVQWWLEWYANTGSTSVNVTVNVTYNDGTTGNLTLNAIGATIRASRMLPLNSFIPAADSGKYIRGVNSVTLSATTGTAGTPNGFGVTATRYRGSVYMPRVNKLYNNIWAETGLPEIYNQSCLFPVCIATATTLGSLRIDSNIVHG
jgi:hypothetical protein